jgi:hypothetical protein
VTDPDRIADEHEILRIRRLWAFSRDQGDWDTVKALFHDDATISISWYSGSVDGFIEGSKKLFSRRPPETRVKHWLGSYRISIANSRAFLETDFEGRVREYIDGHLFDITFEGRFFDRFEKRGGVWKIASWTAVYDNDSITPVIPNSVPASFYEGLSFTGPDAPTACWRFFLTKTGRPMYPMVVGGSEAEITLRRESDVWLTQD